MRRCPHCKLWILPSRWKLHLSRHLGVSEDDVLLQGMREYFGLKDPLTRDEKAVGSVASAAKRKRGIVT